MSSRSLPFVGIDDFALKKRTTYGTIFIDLETSMPIDLLETRSQTSVTKWLRSHPEIKLITRDGSKTYAKAVTEASSKIIQVGDRWHIFHQLFEAVKKTIYNLIPSKWTPLREGKEISVNKSDQFLRKSDLQRQENEERRWKRIQQVQSLYKNGYTITAIGKKLGISRGTVYTDLRQKKKVNHQRKSHFEKFYPLIQRLLSERKTGNQIENVCRSKGYTGSRSTLNTIIAKERRNLVKSRVQSFSFRQKIIRILWDFKKDDCHLERINLLHPALLKRFPKIQELDQLIQSFRHLFIERKSEKLAQWMKQCETLDFPFIQSFLQGIRQDLDAVTLSIREAWSNGPVEGHINRLKTIKRLMYGRASFQVLKNRVLYQF